MKEKRYLYLGFLFVAVIIAFEYYFLAPRTAMTREMIETRYNSLRKDEQFIKGAGLTEADITLLMNDMNKGEKRLIQEKSEFLASAKLQGEVSEMTGKAGLKVLTIRPLTAVKIGNFSAIPVYFEGNGTIRQIGEFLQSLESGRLLISVDKLNLNITNVQNPRDLKFKIQVSGLARI